MKNGIIFQPGKRILFSTLFTVIIVVLMNVKACALADSVSLPDDLTRIEQQAFMRNTEIKEVLIPEKVEFIGKEAFRSCTNLMKITIPASVTEIGENAFAECPQLVIYGYSCSRAATYANENNISFVALDAEPEGLSFSWCNDALYVSGYNGSEAHLVLPSTHEGMPVKGVLSYAFSNDKTIERVDIPEGYTEIQEYAFRECTNLEKVGLPDSIEFIRHHAFQDCTALKKIRLPASLKEMDHGVFMNCISLQGSLDIPDGIVWIGEMCFADCGRLTEIHIPDSVISISPDAFNGCASLSELTLPGGIVYIGTGAFHGCTSLVSVDVSDVSAASPDNTQIQCGLQGFAFSDCSSLKTVKIPGSVKTVEPGAFSNCQLLGRIILGEGITSIGGRSGLYCSVFSECQNLRTVELPTTLTRIGVYAFYGCKSLRNINIPESVREIDDGAFQGCESLSSIMIPESLTNLGEWAFYHCINLQGSVTVPVGVTLIGKYTFFECRISTVEIKGATRIKESAFQNCSNLETVILPESITQIESYAFAGCSSLSTINLGDQLSVIGKYAFRNCYSLEDIYLGSGITQIGIYAFANCISLASDLNLAEGVTSIQDGTFYGCSELRSLTIPSTITSIGDYAFYNCTKLMLYGDSNPNTPNYAKYYHIKYLYRDLQSDFVAGAIENGIEWKYILSLNELVIWKDGTEADMQDWTAETYMDAPWYEYMSEIEQVDVDDGIISIGDYAFYGYPNLSAVYVTDPVTGIHVFREVGAHAFEACTHLSKFGFVPRLNIIGEYAFHNCSALSAIEIPRSLSSLGEEAFTGTSPYFKAYCSWKSPAWNLIETAGYNVQEQLYTVRSESWNETFEHSMEYLVDEEPSFNREMLRLCTVLSFAAYERGIIRTDFRNMGFTVVRQGDEYTVGDHVGYTIGYRNYGENQKIVLVAIRGSYGEPFQTADWQSDLLNVGPDSGFKHTGFHDAEKELYEDLVKRTDLFEGDVTIVITGHSRGAAVGNLLAAHLISNGIISDNKVIAYNIACPRVVTNNMYSYPQCSYVYNILNENDVVTWVPFPGIRIDTDSGVIDTMTSVINYLLTADDPVQPEMIWGRYGHNVNFIGGKSIFTVLNEYAGDDGLQLPELIDSIPSILVTIEDNHMGAYMNYAR